MNVIKSHGMFQFDFTKLTPQEIANVTTVAMVGYTDNITCYNLVNLALRICNQFSGFKIKDFFFDDYKFIPEKTELCYDIAFELIFDFIKYFKLDKDTIKYNEWFGKNFELIDIAEFDKIMQSIFGNINETVNEDDTEPVKPIHEQVEDEIVLSENWFSFVEEMDLSKLEEDE